MMPTPEQFLSKQKRAQPLSLPRDFSDEEMDRDWFLSAKDKTEINKYRRSFRLGIAVQFCAVRLYGRFLTGLQDLSPRIINHLASQLALPPTLTIEEPEREATAGSSTLRRIHCGPISIALARTPLTDRLRLYARVSTHDQHTLPLQPKDLRRYAKQRGWRVVMQIQEVGSGVKERPQREELLRAARRREVDALLVWRLDRWGRSVEDLTGTRRELQDLARGLSGAISPGSPAEARNSVGLNTETLSGPKGGSNWEYKADLPTGAVLPTRLASPSASRKWDRFLRKGSPVQIT